ncbi:hypothetical protein A3762_17670 [Oleiphilus sp. HI0125]|uniref:helix-turn-helix domain-containing protein n=1 Tax=Oleiphilus sp. HI0125 TaxID=1822266 RepID=UPI0007C1FC1F|nr:AraC family transcriptional regulator [Oleiphilus sp. HI0125]KZZ58685.1 hypothetical protein A3762_06725 [Oleiphilus sp. HI0125]KZZ58798.1 hypothetical protein A3762_17670 [Oleiphilus sp. HI0125]
MESTSASPLLYLWEQRTLFIGLLTDPLDISTGSGTLMFGLHKPIRFITSETTQPIECRTLLLLAGMPVIIDTQGELFANCSLDPLGKDYRLLSSLMNANEGTAFYDAESEDTYINRFLELSSAPFDSQEILHSLSLILRTNEIIGVEHNYWLDKRIKNVIKHIQSTISENLSLSDLANVANLSQSRLMELFKKQTGIPIRRYKLWCLLYKTTENVGAGMTLTDAAAEAGFTDSSHFNKSFRSMLGMNPSQIFGQTKQLHVILPDQERSASPKFELNETLID